MYGSPHDIDLFVGGLAERPDGDSLLGPTFSCLIADQFLRTKRGDRYFYSNAEQPYPFTAQQLEQLRRTSLARVYCDNGDGIRSMQKNVFRAISERYVGCLKVADRLSFLFFCSNRLVNCDNDGIARINLKLWMEGSQKS